MKPTLSTPGPRAVVVGQPAPSPAAPGPTGRGSSDSLQGLTRALGVLRLFTESDSLGARAVGGRLGLNPAVAHRILSTLAAEGFLDQDPVSRSYSLGWMTGELGDAYQRANPFFRSARSMLRDLSAATGETAALQVLRDGHRVCLLQHESTQRLRYSMVLNAPMPVTNGATDQVMRAFASPAQRAAIRGALDQAVSGAETPALMGLDVAEKLQADYSSVGPDALAKVRNQGWARGLGMREPDVGSVAVPVQADNQLFVLTVFGPRARIEAADTAELVSGLSAAAATMDNRRRT